MKSVVISFVFSLFAMLAFTNAHDAFAATADRFVFPVLADPTQNSVNPVGNGWTDNNNFGEFCDLCVSPECPNHNYHPGDDLNNSGGDAGLPVYAVANGRITRIVYLGSSLGYAVIIKHDLPQQTSVSQYFLSGTTVPSPYQNTSVVSSAYLHVTDVGAALACGGTGAVVSLGQLIGTIYSSTSGGPHLHFEMRANENCQTADPATNCAGYYQSRQEISNFGYISGLSFINDRTGQSLAADYVGQSESTLPWRKPGETYPLWIKYKNIGTATWNNTGGVSNPNFMELRSVDGPACDITCSGCANHSSWINCQRIGGFGGGTIPPQATATFNFTAQMPNINGPCLQYVAPWSTEGCEDDGSEPNFTLRVDGTLPTVPGTPVASPSTNSVNSFAFSWGASSDAHSGLAGYYWRVNGGAESFTASTSLPTGAYATQQGSNNFSVYSKDIAGNPSSPASVIFTYNVGPCSALLPPCGTMASSSSILRKGNQLQATGVTKDAMSSTSLAVTEQPSFDSWKTVPLAEAAQLSPSAMYSVGFWYRSTSSDALQWALGPEMIEQPTGDLPISTVDHPISDGEWHQFWTAPLRFPPGVTKRPSAILFNGYSNKDIELRDAVIQQIE